MPQSLSSILVHLVFSTKGRATLIQPALEEDLWRYLGAACAAHGCRPYRVGGAPDHVHVLCGLARTLAVAGLVEQIKKSSSKWIKERGVAGFAWQSGYGAFSIGASQVPRVVAYIDGQQDHHRRLTFQEEYRALLRRYQVAFDERYVWD